MFHLLVAAWAVLCIVYLTFRLRSTRKVAKSAGQAQAVAKMRLHGQLASMVVAVVIFALEAGHFLGHMSDRTYGRLLIVAVIAASMAQMISAEGARLHLRRRVRDEARPRLDPPTVLRSVEGGAGGREGRGGQEGPSEQDGKRQP